MIRDPAQLASRSFDLLIIGGGIVGAGIALDASLRGFSCALVEQGDFASGTSSKTTKLIHGGIRYLENYDFPLVVQSLHERQFLLKHASSCVQPLPFLIPVAGRSPRAWPLIRLGVALYDFLAGRSVVGRHRFLNKQQMSAAEPLLSKSSASHGALYYDAQMDDVRLVVGVVHKAAENGATAVNYCSVEAFDYENSRVSGARVKDRLSEKSFSVKADLVINASGPWADRIRQMADPAALPLMRPSKGIHAVYENLGLKHAILLASQKNQRIFFLVPWNHLTLIGTTDTDFSGDPGTVSASEEEVALLLEETNRSLPSLHLRREKVIGTFAGVRPLIAQEKKDPWAVSRRHLIHQDTNGLMSIIGGKYTTFRKIAEEVVDQAARQFSHKQAKPCRTRLFSLENPKKKELIAHWKKEDSALTESLCSHHSLTAADIRYAVECEMAQTLSDLFWRRLGIGWSVCQGKDALDCAARWMGHFLNWSPEEITRQKKQYLSELC